MLDAALQILERDGLAALTLRGVAREANVSHGAPKNHFDNLQGLISELAAEGFVRLGRAMEQGAQGCAAGEVRLAALGRTYVRFALDHQPLFLLMFRHERHDLSRPSLRQAAGALIDLLAVAIAPELSAGGKLSPRQAIRAMLAWSQVHGLASLLIDGKLHGFATRLAPGVSIEMLVEEMLG